LRTGASPAGCAFQKRLPSQVFVPLKESGVSGGGTQALPHLAHDGRRQGAALPQESSRSATRIRALINPGVRCQKGHERRGQHRKAIAAVMPSAFVWHAIIESIILNRSMDRGLLSKDIAFVPVGDGANQNTSSVLRIELAAPIESHLEVALSESGMAKNIFSNSDKFRIFKKP
jgi:hypothetical protein